MQALENNALFTEISAEQSQVVSGGVFNFDLNAYLFILGAGTVFGNPTLTPDEVQFAFEKAISL
ncbi:hypothetical protein [Nostoc sp. CMAA1605]|uniref:hypothetical protein n=1 Tax=Nostoc sp. CMAA1605 TaxID=2055159 RepID=UPI001F4193F8|nr:hypothetical protein [Nostoc sp. CMAA1605]MCF4970392.1 hypothetical protein [Nostoc sp. CMAA1605]